MKKAISNLISRLKFLLLVVLIVGAPTVLNARSGAQKPQALIEETSYDFGEVFVGEDVSHVFRVRNVGDAPLELSDKKPFISLSRARPAFAAWSPASSESSARAVVMRTAPT